MENSLKKQLNQLPWTPDPDQADEYRRKMDCYLSRLFLRMGIQPNKLGFHFLREAVILTVMEPSLQNHLMHDLYPRLAAAFDTTVCSVERSIRWAVTVAWDRANTEGAEKIPGLQGFLSVYEKPGNGELISLLTELVRLLILENKL